MLSFNEMGHISFFNWSTGCKSGLQVTVFYIFLVFIITFFYYYFNLVDGDALKDNDSRVC